MLARGMPDTKTLACSLCGSPAVERRYEETWNGSTYVGYHCAACDLYQTLGTLDEISPEYLKLEDDDLTEAHITLQTSHKGGGFAQWAALMRKLGNGQLQGNLLDIGCGVGGFLDFATSQGLEVYGYDASPVQIEMARRRHPRVANFIDLEPYRATLDAKVQFDFVTMWDVLEHIRTPGALLAPLRAAMSPQGILFVSVPAAGPIGLKLAKAKLLKSDHGLIPYEHVFYYSRKSLRRLFEEHGYEVLDVGGVSLYPRELDVHEAVRRVATAAFKHTPLAFQIYAAVRPRAS